MAQGMNAAAVGNTRPPSGAVVDLALVPGMGCLGSWPGNNQGVGRSRRISRAVPAEGEWTGEYDPSALVDADQHAIKIALDVSDVEVDFATRKRPEYVVIRRARCLGLRVQVKSRSMSSMLSTWGRRWCAGRGGRCSSRDQSSVSTYKNRMAAAVTLQVGQASLRSSTGGADRRESHQAWLIG